MNDSLPPHDGTSVISTQGLTKSFGNLVAVNDLTMQVMPGDVFGFLGPNGSGKTTTIRMLLGLIRPTSGSASLFGMDNTRHLPTILRRIGAIIETPMFYPYLSGLDNLRVFAAMSGMESGSVNNQRYEEILDIVELRSFQKMAYSKYSLGMKQRLGIAAALLQDPELIMLDEPTNGLDPAGMIEIRRLLQRLASLGKTIFLTSHLLYEVQQICNQVAILQKGQLIKQGNVLELLRESERIEVRMEREDEAHYALNILQQAQAEEASWIKQALLERNRQGQLTIKVDAPSSKSAHINALLARRQLYAAEIHPQQGSLEDVFLSITKDTMAAPPIGNTTQPSLPPVTPTVQTAQLSPNNTLYEKEEAQ